MSNFPERLQGLNERLAAAKSEFNKLCKEDGEAYVKALAKHAFAGDPDLQAISWRQYTPYFNDGEPCYFSMGEVYFAGPDDDPHDHEYEWEYDSEACTAFYTDLPDEDAMEVIFGDHVRIFITREELEIRDYSEHD